MGDYNGHHYYISNEKYSYWDAYNHVRSIDTSFRLVSIHSQGENSFIVMKERMVLGTDYPLWIGGTDTVNEGQFVWDDGTDFDYSNWCTGEPNNSYDSGEDYIMINYGGPGLWNDATNTGDDIFHYVFKVKKPSTPQVTPQVEPISIWAEALSTAVIRNFRITYIYRPSIADSL